MTQNEFYQRFYHHSKWNIDAKFSFKEIQEIFKNQLLPLIFLPWQITAVWYLLHSTSDCHFYIPSQENQIIFSQSILFDPKLHNESSTERYEYILQDFKRFLFLCADSQSSRFGEPFSPPFFILNPHYTSAPQFQDFLQTSNFT